MDDDYRAGLERNLRSLLILHLGSGMMLSIAVIVPFLQSNGLGLREILLLQSIFATAIIVLEIPTGYFSDRIGRVPMAIAGSVAGFLAFVVYALSGGFWGFACAEILLSVGFSCYSGTLEALTYDSLLELGREKEFRKINGRQMLMHFGAESAGAVLAGFLALVSLRTPFWANTVPFGIAFIASLSLIEPKRHKIDHHNHWKAVWDICTHTLVRSKALRSIVLLHACIASMTLLLFWSTQPFQQQIGLPLIYFGVTHAVFVAAGALASGFAHTLEKRIDDRLILLGIALTVVACFIALGTIPALWALVFFLLTRTAWGILSPTTNDLVNRMTDSSVRSTVLSVKGMAMRIVFAVAAPFFGAFSDLHGINAALLSAGIIGGIVITIVFLSMRSVWAQIPR